MHATSRFDLNTVVILIWTEELLPFYLAFDSSPYYRLLCA